MSKQITFREAERILRNNGYKKDRINGSHYHYVKDGNRVVINIGLNTMVWKRLCKENNLV